MCYLWPPAVTFTSSSSTSIPKCVSPRGSRPRPQRTKARNQGEALAETNSGAERLLSFIFFSATRSMWYGLQPPFARREEDGNKGFKRCRIRKSRASSSRNWVNTIWRWPRSWATHLLRDKGQSLRVRTRSLVSTPKFSFLHTQGPRHSALPTLSTSCTQRDRKLIPPPPPSAPTVPRGLTQSGRCGPW